MAKENNKSTRSSLPEQGSLISSEDLKQFKDCENCKFRCIDGCC